MSKLLWTQKQDVGPEPRRWHGMAYDPKRKRVVLFGGQAFDQKADGSRPARSLADTWEWDGENWTQIADIGPSAREAFGMAYDSKREKVILFGGVDFSGEKCGDTWEWNGGDWTQLADSGPSKRCLFGMAGDSKRQRVVLFGGSGGAHGSLADTWEWDGSDWTQREEAGPSSRSGHAFAYDLQRERTVLCGGVVSKPAVSVARDTWIWDGTLWTQVADTGPKFSNHAMACIGKELLLFGTDLSATWGWDGKHWTQLQDIGPAGRHMHAMAGDPDRERVVLFGGEGAGDDFSSRPLFNDTWEAFYDAPL